MGDPGSRPFVVEKLTGLSVGEPGRKGMSADVTVGGGASGDARHLHGSRSRAARVDIPRDRAPPHGF